ncbi:Mth938-like domain-containing protein [Crenobacter cavernae]|uniref:Xcc1710-like domain-containing protein n=1 Tax=Crenobacter cavernae TaxID=2290923 RepID=A0ABY0FBC2_9NEIS|nr:Mth938-like domain-containing protein [Crenobacter cavernae]RXZ43336.1 hypothetical protein EBB06_10170 [Crenobacter cavernae]
MKLHQSKNNGNLFTGYGDGFVLINDERFEGNLVVTADSVTAWPVGAFDALEAGHFALVADLAPEVVLFGSGKTIRFPHPRLTAALTNRGVGVEVMDTQAACRTFNILMAEDRKVIALLFT